MITWFKPVRTLSNIPSLLHASHMKCVERLRRVTWDCGRCYQGTDPRVQDPEATDPKDPKTEREAFVTRAIEHLKGREDGAYLFNAGDLGHLLLKWSPGSWGFGWMIQWLKEVKL